MGKRFTYRLVGFVIVGLLMLQSQTSVAQWTLDVMGSVKKEETKKRMEGATITIKRNGTVWKTLTSPANGKFEAQLLPDAVYVIEFSKPGHVTKRMELSTRNVPPDDAKYGFDFPMEMNLFEEMDGLDVSILNQPIAKVAFNPATGYMDYDPDYTKSIKKELDRLKKELAERLKAEEENRKANQKDYDAAIASADKAYNSGKWAEAKPFYEKALSIFPKETYPDFQLADISDKLAGLEAANKKYNSAIERGDKAFAAKEWAKAKTEYKNATALKEKEQYPKDKIKEIDTIVANEKKVSKDYNEAIALADQYLTNKEYDKAKINYEKASGLKSYEEYPKNKLKEIDELLADLAKKEKDYNDAIAQADSEFNSEDYKKSIETYNKALGFKPDETYPKGKIDEATRLIAEMKQIQENYDKFIADGDAAFGSKDYNTAKGKFEEASKLKAKEQYPKDKLTEIEALLSAAAKLDADYANAIKKGDVALGSKDYEEAKTAYETAATLKENEQYPKDKLKEIEGFLAELAKQKEIDEAYQQLITDGDKLLGDKDYDKAKGKYAEALLIKKDEKYPQDKIAEIDGLLAQLAKVEAEKAAREKEYQQLITDADKLLGSKSYDEAKGKYAAALAIKKEEQYPKDKISEIDGLLAELAKEEADKAAQEKKYQQLIADGDQLLGGKSYEDAKGKFTEALTIKKDEQYPKDKISEIDGLLAKLAEQEAEKLAKEKAAAELQAKYDALIVAADKSFGDKSYEPAKAKYTEALELKKEEQYPKDKLKEIEDALAEIARKKAEEEAAKLAEGERDAKYQEAITLADNAMNFENYDQAKIKYSEALGIKPAEQYPKDKLKEIDAALAAIAKKLAEDQLAAESEKKKREYFDALVAEADGELIGKNYKEAEGKYNQALGVIPGEKYPQDKLQEIKDILAKIEADKANAAMAKEELEKKYNDLITQADQSFGTKKYADAKGKYKSALLLKSEEFYPKDQIKEIDRLLAEIAAKEAEITLTNNALKQKQEQYNAFVKKADAELSGKRYSKAISNYEQALGIMPDKTYPKEKIDEINKILAGIAEEDKNNKDAALAEKEKRAEYDKLIYDADRARKRKEYTKAQVGYKEALNLYANEKYPKGKLEEILALLAEQNKPKEVVVSNNTYGGNRAKISDDKEKEIEARMAAMRNKSIIEKDKELQGDKEAYNEQEEIRISAGISRTDEADEQIDKYTEDFIEQTDRGNKYHLENSETLLATTNLLEKAEKNRIKDADKRREESDADLANYTKDQIAFKKEQDELNKDKMEVHNVYVDNVTEAKLTMIDRGDKMRDENRKDLESLVSETEKNKARNKKRREDMEVDVREYKDELAKGEEILISASIDRTSKNGEEIKDLADEMTKQQVEKTNYYKLNVDELVKFKAKIDDLENGRIEKAEKDREAYKKVLTKIESDYVKNTKRQEDRYYDDIQYVDEYKESILKYELAHQKQADNKRIKSNKKIVDAIGTLGVTSQSQEKRYEEFQVKLNEQKKNNNDFMSDLQTMEKERMLLADAGLNDFYIGEKRLSEDSELAKKYPQGITEETTEAGNSITIKRTKVTGSHADVYERVFYTWGGTFFYKNGINITQSLWDKESID